MPGRGTLSRHPRLEIANESGDTVLSISEIADPGIKNWKSIKAYGNPISKLTPLLSAITNSSIAGYAAAMHRHFVDQLSWPDFVELNVRACAELRARVYEGVDGTCSCRT